MNTSIKDIIGLEKPLKKLIETISEGIGVVGNRIFEFDTEKIKRIGQAEAEVEKQKIIAQAEGQEKAIKILGRAEKRFALEQYNKQINLENIIVKTRNDLEGKAVSEAPVEKDWTMRFLDVAQNVSRERLQDVLAKILSGEIQKPGSFSYQTLEIVKYLSQKNLQDFLKFIAISTKIGVIRLGFTAEESLKKYNLDFMNYLDLSNVGIFNQSSSLLYDIDLLVSKPLSLNIAGDLFLITYDGPQKTKKFDFGLLVFSNTGTELRSLLLNQAVNEKSEEYKNDFIKKVQEKGFKIVRQEKIK
ncbi:MAG: DUF2806 domain-containing protein [Patescibacteria group bacterium]|nr:DUF2806 domain-containing protein [Patescibacteria group bacterium]